MVLNKKGGKHTKKGKNKRRDIAYVTHENYPKNEVVYGIINANSGNGRCNLNIIDSTHIVRENVIGVIRGAVRRCKFFKDDVVLCGIRDFNNMKEVDIIHKYSSDHVQRLIGDNNIMRININMSNFDFVDDDLFDDQSQSDNDHIEIQTKKKVQDDYNNVIDYYDQSQSDNDHIEIQTKKKVQDDYDDQDDINSNLFIESVDTDIKKISSLANDQSEIESLDTDFQKLSLLDNSKNSNEDLFVEPNNYKLKKSEMKIIETKGLKGKDLAKINRKKKNSFLIYN